MATGTYQWRQPAPKLPGVEGAGEAPKSPTDPMGAPTQGQSSGSMFGTTDANKTAAGGGDFGSLFKAGPTGAAPTPSFNDLFSGVGEQRQSNITAAQQNIAQGFQPQAEATATTQARNQFQKAQDEAQRQTLEQAALAGRGETGQIVGDNRDFLTKQAMPQAADFEAMLQTNELASNRQRSQDAMGNLLNMEGLGSQERTSQAQLDLQEKQLGESARQFDTQQAFAEWATREGWNQDAITRAWQSSESAAERGSREGIAFAGLNLEEKKLAQEASQFSTKLDFDKWATQAGLDAQTAQRIWQSLESEKERTSTEKVAFAQLSVREKELAQSGQQFADELSFKKFATEGGWSQQEADRAWQSMEGEKERGARAEESGLSRELQKYIADRGFDVDERQLTETIRQFDGKLAFDQWATQAGLDDNEKGRIWEGHLQDLDQKWQSGERLQSQEHQSLIEDKRIQAQTAAQEFDRVANLEVLGKTQEWDAAKLELTNNYQTARDEGQMSHEQAMQAARGDMEMRLTQMGLDGDTARQAADIEARRWETEREITHQSAIANAELLFKYESLRENMGIQQEELALKQQEVNNQVSQFAQTLGLDTARVTEMISIEKNKAAMDTQSILMELAGDNPDMVEFASIQFVSMIQKMGMLSPEEAASMIEEMKKAPSSTLPASIVLDKALGATRTKR